MSHSKKLVMTAAGALAAFGAFMVAPAAFAEDGGSASVGASIKAGVGVSVGSDNEHASATGTVKAEDNSKADLEGSDDRNATGTEMRLENQSQVSAQVRALLQAADRDGGIGEEVRVIAHEFASSSERINTEQENVDKRPAWLTFIIGSNFGSLGKLRSEIATTQNQITRLTAAMDRSTDATVKATLAAQIDALKIQASTTEAFVTDNENQFSLFGWFFRVFE